MLSDRLNVVDLRQSCKHSDQSRDLDAASISVASAPRTGKTGYPLSKMIKLAIDGIMGFSSFPLPLISDIRLREDALLVDPRFCAMAQGIPATRGRGGAGRTSR